MLVKSRQPRLLAYMKRQLPSTTSSVQNVKLYANQGLEQVSLSNYSNYLQGSFA